DFRPSRHSSVRSVFLVEVGHLWAGLSQPLGLLWRKSAPARWIIFPSMDDLHCGALWRQGDRPLWFTSAAWNDDCWLERLQVLQHFNHLSSFAGFIYGNVLDIELEKSLTSILRSLALMVILLR